MTTEQLEQARSLKDQGRSYRQIAAELGLSVVAIWRGLRATAKDNSEETTTNLEDTEATMTPTLSKDAPKSAILAARISEAKSQIVRYEAELARIPEEKEKLLGAVSIDQEAVNALEATEERLTRDLANLRSRVALLERQREGAEIEEAQMRVDAIAARMRQLQTEEDAAQRAFVAAEEAFTRAVERLVAVHTEAGDITGELEYLIERYHATRRELADLQKLPNREESATRIFESLRKFWLREERGESEWARKRRLAWETQHRRQFIGTTIVSPH